MSRWKLLDREAPPAPGPIEPERADPVLAVVDEALDAFAGRTFIARDEVLDRLLDVRNAVAAGALLRALETDGRR